MTDEVLAWSTGPTVVRPLLGPMLELAECLQPDRSLNEFAAMDVLRRHGVLAKLPQTCIERQAALVDIYAAVMDFVAATFKDDATVRDVLAPLLERGVLEADSRLVQAYGDTSAPPPEPKVKARRRRRTGASADGTLSSKRPGERLAGIAPT